MGLYFTERDEGVVPSLWTTARRRDTRRPIAWRSAEPEARGYPSFPRGTWHVPPTQQPPTFSPTVVPQPSLALAGL